MPYALLIMGLILVRAGYKNQTEQLQTLIIKDFTGPGSFLYWCAAVGIIGGLGYIEPLRVPSRAMLVLVILVLILSHNGVFQQFTDTLANFTPSTPASATDIGTGQTTGNTAAPTQAQQNSQQAATDLANNVASGNAGAAASGVFRYFMQGPADLLHSFGF